MKPHRPPVQDEHGTYGFTWGPFDVVRAGHVPGRGYWLLITSDHQQMTIYVSEHGRVITARRVGP